MSPLSKKDLLIQGVSDSIFSKFKAGAYGVIVSGIPNIPVIEVVATLAQSGPVFTSLIGCPALEVEKYAEWASGVELEFGFGATHAVRVRNEATSGALKVAFVWREEERLHSLSRRGYKSVGPQDVVTHICRNALESSDSNVPEKNLWAVLGSADMATYATLDAVLNYYEGVFRGALDGSRDHEAPRRLLYLLGLLPDPKLLTGRTTSVEDIKRRLQENGRLVERLQRADPADRSKASDTVRGNPDESANKNYRAFLRIAGGDLKALRDLTFEDAQKLLGKTGGEGGRRRRRGGGDRQPRRQFDSLAEAAVELVVTGEADLLRELLDKADEELRKSEQRTGRLEEGDVFVRFSPDDRALALTRMFSGLNRFGGRLQDYEKDADQVLSVLGEHVERAEVLNDVYLRLLMQKLPAGRDLSMEFRADELLGKYLEHRRALVPHVDTLAVAPLALLIGNSKLIDDARKMIDSYHQLLANLEEQYGALNRLSSEGTPQVYNEILAVDMIRIEASDDTVVLLSPVHPLVLWKYVELATLVLDRKDRLPETDRDFLTDHIWDLPEPLLALYVPGRREGGLELGYSERVGSLPVYRPAVVTAADPMESSVRLAADKLAALYPAVKEQLRLMVVNPRSLAELARAVRSLTGENGFHQVSILLARYGLQNAGEAQLPSDLDDLAIEERVLVEEISVDSIEKLRAYLSKHPVHLLAITGERSKNVRVIVQEGTRLHPLSFPHKITADQWAGKITIKPRSVQTDEGGIVHPFGTYQRLISQLSGKDKGELSQNEVLGVSLDECKSLLPSCLFMLLASDPGVEPSEDILRLTHGMALVGDSVITRHTQRIHKGIEGLLRQMHYRPSSGGVAKLLSRLQEIGGQGIFATISETGTYGFSERALRGQLGLAVALDWYHQSIMGARFSIVGLDGHLARAWLRGRDDGKRNDFLAVREESDGSIHIDLTEVKGYEATSDNDVHDSYPGQQLRSVAQILYDILHHQGDLLVDRRRELLRLQMFREGFRHMSMLDSEWVGIVNDVLDGKRTVSLNLYLIEVVFDDNIRVEERVFDPEEPGDSPVDNLPVRRIRLGESVIQAHLAGIAERMDNASLDRTDAGEDRAEGTFSDAQVTSSGPDEVSEVSDTESNVEEVGTLTSLGFEPDQNERREIEQTAGRIYQVLSDINVRLTGRVDPELADVGPSVVRYKVRLQTGEKLSSLQSRTRDLMRELATTSEPMIDNLPNTNFIYIDIPRRNRRPAPFRPVLAQFLSSTHEGITCPIGVTPDGRTEEIDLTSLPHMLVAGSTGSGKTMFLYSLLVGLSRAYSPQELQLVLIDPKQTDFVFFNELSHLRGGRVITDAREAIGVLMELLEDELSARTTLLTEARSRDIKSYNARHPESPVPPILVVIDEFADLSDVMERAEREQFEGALRRLAQRARNVGIHLIIATQRPTVDIVNGTLKSNLPCRVSFRLASLTDSRVILDQGGAEHLLGNGDMLISRNGRVTRLQGFYLSEEEMVELLDG